MSEGAIPWTAIREYCFFNRFEDETIDDMLFIVPRMDAAYLKYRAEEMKKEAQSGK